MRPVQEEALLHFIKREDVFVVLPTGCGKSLIFQLVPKVCSYLHDRGFSYPKVAIIVVICSLNALIDSHILGLREHGIPACIARLLMTTFLKMMLPATPLSLLVLN